MSEAQLQFLITLNDRLRPLRDPVEIQDVATSLLGDHLGLNRVLYGDMDGDEFIVSRSYASMSAVPKSAIRPRPTKGATPLA